MENNLPKTIFRYFFVQMYFFAFTKIKNTRNCNTYIFLNGMYHQLGIHWMYLFMSEHSLREVNGKLKYLHKKIFLQ